MEEENQRSRRFRREDMETTGCSLEAMAQHCIAWILDCPQQEKSARHLPTSEDLATAKEKLRRALGSLV